MNLMLNKESKENHLAKNFLQTSEITLIHEHTPPTLVCL